jgi:hypothetical protein
MPIASSDRMSCIESLAACMTNYRPLPICGTKHLERSETTRSFVWRHLVLLRVRRGRRIRAKTPRIPGNCSSFSFSSRCLVWR